MPLPHYNSMWFCVCAASSVMGTSSKRLLQYKQITITLFEGGKMFFFSNGENGVTKVKTIADLVLNTKLSCGFATAQHRSIPKLCLLKTIYALVYM